MRRSLLLRLRPHPSPLWIIFEINFLRNLATGLLMGILPIYFRKFVSSDAAVGVIFFIGYTAATISNFYSSKIISTLKKRKTLLIALFFLTMLFASFAFATHTALILLIFALYQFALSLFIVDVGLYIKHFSNYKELAENTGKLGSFGNIGWLIGPLLGALIAERFGFEMAFMLSSAISLLALISFFFVRMSHEEITYMHHNTFMQDARRFFKDANLRRTYINNAGLGFIYSIWDFLPLLMLTLGAPLAVIGMTKSLMGVPQSIFEFPLGRMADKETGERKLFIAGYALAFLFTALLGLTTNIRLFITFFFIAATGTSFLEMTRDSYFFRQMQEKNVELIGVYRTSDTLPHLVGQGLAVATLSFFSIKTWFVLGAIIGVVFIINAYRLMDLRAHPPSYATPKPTD